MNQLFRIVKLFGKLKYFKTEIFYLKNIEKLHIKFNVMILGLLQMLIF